MIGPASVDDEVARSDGEQHAARAEIPHTGVHRIVRRFLEPLQDVLVVVLTLALFAVMVRALVTIGTEVLAPGISIRSVISETLLVLVLIELQRLLIVYLRDHHVSVDVMIEATLVGALREALLLIAVQVEPFRLLTLTVFVLALGALLRFGDLRAPRRRVRARGASQAPDTRRAERSAPRR